MELSYSNFCCIFFSFVQFSSVFHCASFFFHFCFPFIYLFLLYSIEIDWKYLFEKQITDAPIFIYIHGGYWHALDKTVSAYAVQPLVDAGHKVIILDYDLCPNITLEQLVDQIQRAGIFIVNYAASMQTKWVQYPHTHTKSSNIGTLLNPFFYLQNW